MHMQVQRLVLPIALKHRDLLSVRDRASGQANGGIVCQKHLSVHDFAHPSSWSAASGLVRIAANPIPSQASSPAGEKATVAPHRGIKRAGGTDAGGCASLTGRPNGYFARISTLRGKPRLSWTK